MKRRNFLKSAWFSLVSAAGTLGLISCSQRKEKVGPPEPDIDRRTESKRVFDELGSSKDAGAALEGAAAKDEHVKEVGRSLKAPAHTGGSARTSCVGGKTTCDDADSNDCPQWHICGSSGHGGDCANEVYCSTGKKPCAAGVKNHCTNKVCIVPF
jgi:hypothetical protein